MNLARSLERRIEHLVEGVGNRVFPGRLHPTEVAIRMVREAELSLVDTGVGPTSPNHFVVELNRADLGEDAADIVRRLAALIEDVARERGWRLEGPASVSFQTSDDVAAGSSRVATTIRPGSLQPWATLVEVYGARRLAVTKNRSLIGRSQRADVLLGDDSVSRTHALLWIDSGGTWLRDLASSNGTTVNGTFIGDIVALRDGDVIGFGTARFSFRPI